MKTRFRAAAVALALVATACTGGADSTDTTIDDASEFAAVESPATTAPSETTTTTQAPETTTTTVASAGDAAEILLPSGSVPPPEAKVLSYAYTPDSTLSYQVDLDQQITMFVDGDAEAMEGDEELPLDAQLGVTASSEITYEVYPGPEEGTYEVVITGDFADATVTGTVNGESIDELEEGSLTGDVASLEPISASVIVDEAGNIISALGDELDLLGGGLGELGGLGGGATDQLGRPVGPAFPTDRELTVGDTWTETTSEEGPNGEVISATVTHTVVDAQQIGDAVTLVIESVTETDAIEIDFTEFFRAFFEGFASLGGDESGELPPEMQEMLDQIEFRISVAPATANATTWFDPDSGLVRRVESQSTVAITMVFRGPDEATGEVVGFEMDMEMDQEATMALVEETT
jgi:hypothetical protein